MSCSENETGNVLFDLTLLQGEFVTENNIRMLEQLNKTLELLQSKACKDPVISFEETPRKVAEDRVLDCIAMMCSPCVAFEETNSVPVED